MYVKVDKGKCVKNWVKRGKFGCFRRIIDHRMELVATWIVRVLQLQEK